MKGQGRAQLGFDVGEDLAGWSSFGIWLTMVLYGSMVQLGYGSFRGLAQLGCFKLWIRLSCCGGVQLGYGQVEGGSVRLWLNWGCGLVGVLFILGMAQLGWFSVGV
jgi:hypothetical protein